MRDTPLLNGLLISNITIQNKHTYILPQHFISIMYSKARLSILRYQGSKIVNSTKIIPFPTSLLNEISTKLSSLR